MPKWSFSFMSQREMAPVCPFEKSQFLLAEPLRTVIVPVRSVDSQNLTRVTIRVEIWDEDHGYRKIDQTDSQGFFEVLGLEAGTFFVATNQFNPSDTHLDMLFEGIPCPAGPPNGCDPTKGTPVSIYSGATTRFVDLALPSSSEGIVGMVTDFETGVPLSGIFIDLWNADSGTYERGFLTSPAGTFLADVDPGSYVAATDNSGDWVNQIFDGIECVGGSPYNGDCDPMTGTVIIVEEDELTPGIDFQLRANIQAFFADGFETGDTRGWDSTFP